MFSVTVVHVLSKKTVTDIARLYFHNLHLFSSSDGRFTDKKSHENENVRADERA